MYISTHMGNKNRELAPIWKITLFMHLNLPYFNIYPNSFGNIGDEVDLTSPARIYIYLFFIVRLFWLNFHEDNYNIQCNV